MMNTLPFESIKQLLPTQSQAEKLQLVQIILSEVGQEPSSPTHPLFGILEGKVPDDFDLDAALKEIRHQWEEDLEEILKEPHDDEAQTG